jgi:hypothetical protein
VSRRRRLSELPIPPAAYRDPQAAEAVRVWMTKKGPVCSVGAGVWERCYGADEPTGWGALLADTALDAAKEGKDPARFVRTVSRVIAAELDRDAGPAGAP